MELADQTALLNIIEGIYKAATDHKHWSGVVHDIANAVGASGGNLYIVDYDQPQAMLQASTIFSTADIEAYNDDYAALDVWNHKAAARASTRVYTSEELISHRQYRESQIYQEFTGPRKIDKGVGGFFLKSGNNFGFLGMLRTIDQKAFGKIHAEFLQQLYSHLNRAFTIQSQLARSELCNNYLSDSQDRSAMGVILFDRDRKVVVATSRAEKQISKGGLRIINRTLHAEKRDQNDQLQKFVGEILETSAGMGISAGGVMPLSRSDGSSLHVLISPYQPNPVQIDLLNKPVVGALYLYDPDEPHTYAIDPLRKLYSFSDAEARVCVGLLNGKTIAQIAEMLCIGQNGVRFHVKNLFRKTDTNRQAELMVKLTRESFLLHQFDSL